MVLVQFGFVISISFVEDIDMDRRCTICKHKSPHIAPSCNLDYVSPVDGRTVKMSCKCAREKECYCGAFGKLWVPDLV